jgi:hypothetical protein
LESLLEFPAAGGFPQCHGLLMSEFHPR